MTLLATVALDQATKAAVVASVDRGEQINVFFGLDLTYTRNSGVAFGLFGGGGVLLVAVAVVAIVAVIAFLATTARRARTWAPLGLLIGGAAGNLVDRVRDGAVTDFIDLPAWPPFNVADMAFTFGVLAMLWVLEGPRAPHRSR